MCRSILELRGLEPPATAEEIEASARQFIRKVSGIRQPKGEVIAPFEAAVAAVANETRALLAVLPARRQPPKKVPPNRLGHPI
ncbi:MAG TPA: DUF2277 domain-containing protein [Acidimicrobiales bacterium]|nr:DUF2277 domain-containing protein [Acidimicrobiales bacterium]